MILIAATLACLLVVMEAAGLPTIIAGVRKRSTGIVGLNLLLDGGFPAGSVIMIHGTAVAGVDLAARQFCDGGDGEPGTYICPEDLFEDSGAGGKMNPAAFLGLMGGMRVVIDSLSSIIERYGIEQTLFLLSLAKERIREQNANLLFIVYSEVHPPIDMTRIMRMSDVVIELTTQEQQAEIQRSLLVQKIRGGAVPQRMLPFIITESGIEASTTSRVV
jgi:KaiC/GvpD/RAD55 family RecA-like ATPase